MRVPRIKKNKFRAKVGRHHRGKVALVAAVRVDQQVMCPSCEGPMYLSESWQFNCEQCKQGIPAEQAFAILETAGA